MQNHLCHLWDLPDNVLFSVISFVARPTHRTAVLCHIIAPLCKTSYRAILEEESEETNEETKSELSASICVKGSDGGPTSNERKRRSMIWDHILAADYGGSSEAKVTISRKKRQRRCSARLQRNSFEKIRDAHQLVVDNTEICFFYVSEMCCRPSSSSSKTTKLMSQQLTKGNLAHLLNEYGPHLRLNSPVRSTGGVFLVEVCRARHVTESTVLRCVRELVENHGADVSVCSKESPTSTQSALCVAAVRGMPSVVKYLLQHHHKNLIVENDSAREHTHRTTCGLFSGRFALHTTSTDNKKKRQSLRCVNVSALEFTKQMRQAELDAGASSNDVRRLTQCIRFLESHTTIVEADS